MQAPLSEAKTVEGQVTNLESVQNVSLRLKVNHSSILMFTLKRAIA